MSVPDSVRLDVLYRYGELIAIERRKFLLDVGFFTRFDRLFVFFSMAEIHSHIGRYANKQKPFDWLLYGNMQDSIKFLEHSLLAERRPPYLIKLSKRNVGDQIHIHFNGNNHKLSS